MPLAIIARKAQALVAFLLMNDCLYLDLAFICKPDYVYYLSFCDICKVPLKAWRD